MYKDKEKQKEYQRKQMQRRRQGITLLKDAVGITGQGITGKTPQERAKVRQSEKTPQERAREILPAERFKLVEHLVKKYNEPERYERAVAYREWELLEVTR